jgi:hypothetical protein
MKSVDFLDVITTMETDANSIPPTSTTIAVNQTEKCELLICSVKNWVHFVKIFSFQDTNYSLSESVQYKTSGLSLGNSLYLNTVQWCFANGSVVAVYLRLFTDWKDDTPLYLFTIPISVHNVYSIRDRYAIQPQRNTTDWQIIKIPSGALPIFLRDFLAIGMQESSTTGQIYAINSSLMLSGANINEYTTNFTAKGDLRTGVAFSYTIVHNDK